MSNELRWQDKGLTHHAPGRNNREYIIYTGDHITVIERINDPQAARDYLGTRSAATTFKHAQGRYAKQARSRQRRKRNGKTVVLHQRVVKTVTAAKKLAQEWHNENV
jgi:hypothetical protein